VRTKARILGTLKTEMTLKIIKEKRQEQVAPKPEKASTVKLTKGQRQARRLGLTIFSKKLGASLDLKFAGYHPCFPFIGDGLRTTTKRCRKRQAKIS